MNIFIPCNHQNGVMIPQTDNDGNYVKPEFMICNNCRLVTKPKGMLVNN